MPGSAKQRHKAEFMEQFYPGFSKQATRLVRLETVLERIAQSQHWPEEGQAWGYLLDEATHDLLRELVTPNVEFSGVPAGHSSNHPAGGTSAGTQG